MNAVGLIRILGVFGAGLLAAQQGAYVGIEEKLPLPAPVQPVPFSHRQHSTAGIKCADCHAKAQREERAGIPAASQCMVCHVAVHKDSSAVKQIARFASEGKPIPWVRIYRLPDFVFFSHGTHTKAGVECQVCHGPVAQREVLQKEVSTSMRTCMDCHRERKASVDCSRCHELGQ
jgi:formate-dependent nitrite reductase cytochrome c552 subunit